MKKTVLVSDDPSVADEIGTHQAIADLIANEIEGKDTERSIAVIGDWGSGKSTIIRLLEHRLKSAADGAAKVLHFFRYDAWAHEGDPLRRGFLDDLLASIKAAKIIDDDDYGAARDKIWNRTEITETTTEPSLRRHAKILLLAAALIPFGLALIYIPESLSIKSSYLLSSRNLLALSLIISPLLVIFILFIINTTRWEFGQRFLFGTSYKEKNFSVLSFFVQRTSGAIERRYVKTPADSVGEFQQIFNEIVQALRRKGGETARLVIVVDNIDRLPAEKAREFWATIQIFFNSGAGRANVDGLGYWLVVPFSDQALANVFANSANSNQAEAALQTTRSYVDKTFGLSFYVPPPILKSWRRFLLDKLLVAFPDHAETELSRVRNLFDLAAGDAPTPREMKIFINNCVTQYRLRGEEFSLTQIAAYVLHRNDISQNEIADDLLTAAEQRMLGSSDWQAVVAALHFGVTEADSIQLLIREPSRRALREGNGLALSQLEPRVGFYDVLPIVVLEELETFVGASGKSLCQIAEALASLSGSGNDELRDTWSYLGEKLRSVNDWDRFEYPIAPGLQKLVSHLVESERERVKSDAIAALGREEMPLPNPGPDAAINLLDAAAAMVVGQDVVVTVPGPARFALDVLIALSEHDKYSVLAPVMAFQAKMGDVAGALASEVVDGFDLEGVAFVRQIQDMQQLKWPWAKIVEATKERLTETDAEAAELSNDMRLMLGMAFVANDRSAIASIRSFSETGILSDQFGRHKGELEVKAVLLTAVILANPGFKRTGPAGASAAGDALVKTAAREADASLADAIAHLVAFLDAEELLLVNTATQPFVMDIGTKALAAIVRREGLMQLRRDIVSEHLGYIAERIEQLGGARFIDALSEGGKLVEGLAGSPLRLDWTLLYRAALGSGVDRKAARTLSRTLMEKANDLEVSAWESCVTTPSDPLYDLLERLVELDTKVRVKLHARDALLAVARRVRQGELDAVEISRCFQFVLVVLTAEGRRSLLRDIFDDLSGASSVADIERVVSLVGDQLVVPERFDFDRVVRRILSPVIAEPTELAIAWAAKLAAGKQRAFGGLAADVRAEFEDRLSAALEQHSSNEVLQRSLVQIREGLGLRAVSKTIDGPNAD